MRNRRCNAVCPAYAKQPCVFGTKVDSSWKSTGEIISCTYNSANVKCYCGDKNKVSFDSCSGAYNVIEYYCENNEVKSSTKNCWSSYTMNCGDGRCKSILSGWFTTIANIILG